MSRTHGVVYGPDEDSGIPKESMGKYLLKCLKSRRPTEIVNIDAFTKETLTCGQLLEQSILLATAMKDLGVQKGSTITIVSENTVNYMVPVLAALYIGVSVNPLNPDYSAGELKHALLISKSKLIFCSEGAIEKVLQLRKETEFIETIILMGSCPSDVPYVKTITDVLDSVVVNVEGFHPETLDCCDQDALIMLSSGTTGLPKGVLLTHQNLRAIASNMGHPQYGNVTSKDTTVQIVPLFHVFGIMLQTAAIAFSMKVVLMNRFNPKVYLRCIQEYKATVLFTVPSILLFLAKSDLIDDYDLSSVKEVLCGAAPIGKELLAEISRRLGEISIRNMYGLTETSGACTFQVPNSSKVGSVGHLVPGAIAKVVHPDTNKVVGPLQTGEICFKGHMVMKKYVGNAIADCFDDSGFYHSGDVGFYDKDGEFYIVDRLKELIKYKGFQVSPTELEVLILTHPLVKDCGVIGIPDERAGQVPLAFVVLQNGIKLSEQEIIRFVAGRISVQKHLYGGVKFLKEIPKTASGKIWRKKLLEIYNSCSTEVH